MATASLRKLQETAAYLLKRIKWLEKDLKAVGDYSFFVSRIESIERQSEKIEQEMDQVRREFIHDKFGLFGAIFKIKELSPTGINRIEILAEQRGKLYREKIELTGKISLWLRISDELKKEKILLDGIHNRINSIENKKDALESLKNKAAKVSKEKRQIGKSVKNRLVKNDICPYCGKKILGDGHADHIYPVSKGGESRAKNMVMVCSECNLKKRDHTLQSFIKKHNLDRYAMERRLDMIGKEY